MADPQYEYGLTPEETDGGILGLFNILSGSVVDAFTPERRAVITPPETTYTESDGAYYKSTTPGVYGEAERGIEYMPVVQGAKGAYDFAGKFFSDGKVREEIVKGIGQMFSDYTRSATEMGSGGEGTSFYDPEAQREVSFDPLLPLGLLSAGLLAPVKVLPGETVLGMFAGRNAATAKRYDFERAAEMAAKGSSRKEIWDETGLFRWERNGEPVSDWRFEISDLDAKAVFNPRAQTPTGRLRENENPVLSDLFQHPKFFEAFPGKIGALTSSSLEALTKARAALRVKLAELKASNKNPDDNAKEYQKLQEEDGALLNDYILSKSVAAPVLPSTASSGPPFVGSGARQARMDRPVADIPLKTMPGSEWGGAYYSHYLDNIGTKARPGAPLSKRLQAIPWDEDGKYVRRFSHSKLLKHTDKTYAAFRDAGISLDSSMSGGRTSYRLRKWHGEDSIDPKSLPEPLKKLLDELKAEGRIYYKKDYDPTPVFRDNAIHEGQHSIQYRTPEFEGGGNRKEFLNTKVNDPRTGKKLSATEVYMRILGEMEARLAAKRKDLTDKERNEKLPWTEEGGLDRRENDLILRKDLQGGASQGLNSGIGSIELVGGTGRALKEAGDLSKGGQKHRVAKLKKELSILIGTPVRGRTDTIKVSRAVDKARKTMTELDQKRMDGLIGEIDDLRDSIGPHPRFADLRGDPTLIDPPSDLFKAVDKLGATVRVRTGDTIPTAYERLTGASPNEIKFINEALKQRFGKGLLEFDIPQFGRRDLLMLGPSPEDLLKTKLRFILKKDLQGKASGGMVSKPLYDDARTGNMI